MRFRSNREIMSFGDRKSEIEQHIYETKNIFKEKMLENESLLKSMKKKKNELEGLKNMEKKYGEAFKKCDEKDGKAKEDLKFESENIHKYEVNIFVIINLNYLGKNKRFRKRI